MARRDLDAQQRLPERAAPRPRPPTHPRRLSRPGRALAWASAALALVLVLVLGPAPGRAVTAPHEAPSAPIPALRVAPDRLVRTVGACVLVAPPGAERALERLAPEAALILPDVSRELGVAPRAPFTLVLLPERAPRDSDLQALDRAAPAWAAGFMSPEQRVGAIRLAQAARYPYGTPEAVLAHESAHLVLHDAPGFAAPLWFEEGVANWVARSWQLQDLLMLASRLLTREVPRLDTLSLWFHGTPDQVDEAYAASFAFVSWCVHRYGDGFVADVVRASRGHSFERAWTIATGETVEHAEAVWRRESLVRYRWLPLLAASSPFWLLVLAIATWVWVRRRAHRRAQEHAWETDDETEPWLEEDEVSSEPPSEPPQGGMSSEPRSEPPKGDVGPESPRKPRQDAPDAGPWLSEWKPIEPDPPPDREDPPRVD